MLNMFEIDPRRSVFYSIDQAIKEYRKYAQNQISAVIPNITLDQILTLIIISKETEVSQKELAQTLFKDYASITRIIELLVKKGFLSRSINQIDRRKFILKLTLKGNNALTKLTPIIFENRRNALESLTDKEMKNLKIALNKITNNCIQQRTEVKNK